MADTGLIIELDEELGQRLRAAAEAVGRSVNDYVVSLLSGGLDDWAEDHARLAEYDRTGEYVEAETVMAEFRESLAERLALKRR